MTTSTDPILTYFHLAAGSEDDTYLGQFDAAAVVEDDGHQHRGMDAIRTWRGTIPPVDYEVLDTSADEGTIARVRISGDFPGSPVVLAFRFGFDGDGLIAALTIRPEVPS